MNTNNFFSAKRFGLVFRNDFLENKKLYFLGLLFVFGIVLIVALGVGGVLYEEECKLLYKGILSVNNYDPMHVNMLALFYMGSIVFTCVVASFSFSKMKSKQGRIADLTLPASHFEKFLVRRLNTVVLNMLAFVIVFFIADFLRVVIFEILYPDLSISLTSIINDVPSDGRRLFKMWFFNLVLLQSIYFLGSVCMPKYSLIKTFVVVMLVTICYSVLLMWLVVMNDTSLRTNENIEYWYSGMTIINYIVAYYRYRESEVIHRLF